jgi:hypothetical protein
MAIENLILNFAQKRLGRKSHHSCCSAHSQSLQSAERESTREREKGMETVNAHMYLRTLCLKCELC